MIYMAFDVLSHWANFNRLTNPYGETYPSLPPPTPINLINIQAR